MIDTPIDICKGCGEEKPIVNKKYYLCYECNHVRLHGETYEQKQKRKEIQYSNKLTTASKIPAKSKKQKPLKQQTSKQSGYLVKLNQSYQEFDQMMVDSDAWYCRGCGIPENLSHSHILGQDWCKKNDLEYLCFSHDNITLHCLSTSGTGCHEKWESGDINKMLELNDFWFNVEFIKSISTEQYQRIVLKLQEKGIKIRV